MQAKLNVEIDEVIDEFGLENAKELFNKYYQEFVLAMKYDERTLNIINNSLGEYIEIKGISY
mgnify:CR=1 FL=1